MRFSDFKAEVVHARNALEKLEEAGRREWILFPKIGDPFTVSLRVFAYADGTHHNIDVSTLTKEPHAHVLVGDYTFSGGYFDHRPYPLGHLTSLQLELLTLVKSMVESWIDGSRLDLPPSGKLLITYAPDGGRPVVARY